MTYTNKEFCKLSCYNKIFNTEFRTNANYESNWKMKYTNLRKNENCTENVVDSKKCITTDYWICQHNPVTARTKKIRLVWWRNLSTTWKNLIARELKLKQKVNISHFRVSQILYLYGGDCPPSEEGGGGDVGNGGRREQVMRGTNRGEKKFWGDFGSQKSNICKIRFCMFNTHFS